MKYFVTPNFYRYFPKSFGDANLSVVIIGSIVSSIAMGKYFSLDYEKSY